jgi:hypothetical protein
MNARKSAQPIQKTTPSPEAPTVVGDKLRDSLMHIFDDFMTAHALVKVAYRHIEEWDDEDRGAVLVLGIGVQALDDFSDQIEGIRRAQKRPPTGGAS